MIQPRPFARYAFLATGLAIAFETFVIMTGGL